MRTLTRAENRWARAAFAAIFPAHPVLGAGIATCDIEGYLVDLRTRVPWRAALGVRLAIWIVALAPLWVLRRPATLLGVGPAERERVVRALLGSRWYPLRQLTLLLKALGAMLYARADAVRAAIAPPLGEGVADTGPRLISLGRAVREDDPGDNHNDEQGDHGRHVA